MQLASSSQDGKFVTTIVLCEPDSPILSTGLPVLQMNNLVISKFDAFTLVMCAATAGNTAILQHLLGKGELLFVSC